MENQHDKKYTIDDLIKLLRPSKVYSSVGVMKMGGGFVAADFVPTYFMNKKTEIYEDINNGQTKSVWFEWRKLNEFRKFMEEGRFQYTRGQWARALRDLEKLEFLEFRSAMIDGKAVKQWRFNYLRILDIPDVPFVPPTL